MGPQCWLLPAAAALLAVAGCLLCLLSACNARFLCLFRGREVRCSARQDEEELEQEQAEEAEGLGSDEEGAEAMEEDGGMPGTDLAVYGALLGALACPAGTVVVAVADHKCVSSCGSSGSCHRLTNTKFLLLRAPPSLCCPRCCCAAAAPAAAAAAAGAAACVAAIRLPPQIVPSCRCC